MTFYQEFTKKWGEMVCLFLLNIDVHGDEMLKVTRIYKKMGGNGVFIPLEY
jgi:hypothetical protein